MRSEYSAPVCPPECAERMPQVFPKSANPWSRASLVGVLFLVLGARLADRAASAIGLRHGGQRVHRAARPVLAPASRRRHRHRLPLLPHLRGSGAVGRHSADQDLHQLPLPDLVDQPLSRAGARELPRGAAAALDSGPRPAGFRLFQSQHPRQQGRRLRDLSRPRGSNAADGAEGVAADGVVSRLPPRSGEVRAAAGGGVPDGISPEGAISARSASGWCANTASPTCGT